MVIILLLNKQLKSGGEKVVIILESLPCTVHTPSHHSLIHSLGSYINNIFGFSQG